LDKQIRLQHKFHQSNGILLQHKDILLHFEHKFHSHTGKTLQKKVKNGRKINKEKKRKERESPERCLEDIH
jgi:hypothetical protein